MSWNEFLAAMGLDGVAGKARALAAWCVAHWGKTACVVVAFLAIAWKPPLLLIPFGLLFGWAVVSTVVWIFGGKQK